ncbi:MAG: polysaccharide deacetylase family protein [Burkholderiales bacterium]|nr:polysaccharide deacetylase family protein [Burkholderiales bacterium]
MPEHPHPPRSARPAAAPRHVAVVLHDVAPATWPACRRLLSMLRAVAHRHNVRLRVTLLVVPAWHGEPATTPFVRWLHRMQEAGHELALHGLTHQDDGPPARDARERWLRRVYTAGEGEFAALDHIEALRRLAIGRAWALKLHLAMRGFVPPAWLMSPAAREAVRASGFAYTCTLNEIVSLPEGRRLHARSLVFSTRAAWRRLLSLAWVSWLALSERRAPLWRLELHPADVEHAAIRRCVRRLLHRALADGREPLRLAEVERRVMRAGTANAMAAA